MKAFAVATTGWMVSAIQINTSPAGPFHTKNLCIDGKIVPQIYGIGAQKAATTFFWEVFRASPSYTDPSVDTSNQTVEANLYHSIKELHSFDDLDHWNMLGGRMGWLKQFPKCEAGGRRQVIADFSPGYLAHTKYTPAMLSKVYQDQKNLLRFIVSLREPVARMYSDFWMFKNFDYFHSFWVSHPRFSFNWLASHVVNSSQCYNNNGGNYDSQQCHDDFVGGSLLNLPTWVQEFVSKSRYPNQLRAWFKTFAATQFTVIPMKFLFLSTKYEQSDLGTNLESPVARTWTQMGMQFPAQVPADPIENSGSYPKIEESLGAKELTKLRTVMNRLCNADSLTKVLYNSGARLWKCDHCSRDHVRRWILKNW